MAGADAIMRRASSFTISRGDASVASTYHIITPSCRAADWSTAKLLPCEFPCPPTRPSPFPCWAPDLPLVFSFPTAPPHFSLSLSGTRRSLFLQLGLLSSVVSRPVAVLYLSAETTRTGPADGPSTAVSAAAVAALVLHLVQSRFR